MAFKFVHTADWQIGKPFARFPVEVQSVLREARLTAIDRIGELAMKSGADHILVGGDIHDSEGMSDLTLRQPLEYMRNHKRLTWHLLPGNHDPVRPSGIWDRVAAASVPGNVRVYLAPEALNIAPGVSLLVAPLRGKTTSEDPTAWMDAAETSAGAIRIGLAHGSIGRYGTDDHASVPIDAGRAEKAGLAYLALGDDHGMKKINDRTWYSGTPEADGWRQNDPGHALLVSISGPDAPAQVTPERTGQFAWGQFEAGVDADGSIVGLTDQLEALPANIRSCLVQLTLKGAVSLGAAQNLDRHIDRLAARLRHLEPDRSGLRREAGPEDIAVLGAGTELHKVGTRLMRKLDCAEASSDEAEIALQALTELIGRTEEQATP
ncbi:MAG: metallophosphoesterase family protein [Hyphomicrobiaceae bacterium]